MSARSDAESVAIGRQAFRLAVPADTVDESPSLLLRLSLAPIDCVAVERDLLETDRVGDDEVGSYGRLPKAIRTGGHASRPFWRISHELHKDGRSASPVLAAVAPLSVPVGEIRDPNSRTARPECAASAAVRSPHCGPAADRDKFARPVGRK